MQKYKCTISYDGTNYAGFQIQPNAHTIQAEIEHVLATIHKGRYIQIHASGRTDKGVHAKAQVFHFETDVKMPLYNWKKALNSLLPNDIFIDKMEETTAEFHARLHATEKEYRYYVLNIEHRNVFRRNNAYHEFAQLNVEAMKSACELFIGTHDFTSFSSAKSTVKGSKIRTLYEVSLRKSGEEIEFILRGNGFLYNMVRIIVGVLLDVGKGKLTLEEVQDIFVKKNRQSVGKTLPPQGLFLWDVSYVTRVVEE